MACLGMFVSCSDDPQEVVVVDSVGAEFEWAGNAVADTATYTANSSSYYTYSVSIDSDKFASISYYDNAKGNMKSYYVEVPVIRTEKSSGSSSSQVYKDEAEFRVKKVGNDYYYNGTKLTVTGSPEDKEFTIASIETYNYKFTNLKFTRM